MKSYYTTAEPQHVLVLTISTALGGAERCLLDAIQALKKSKRQVLVILPKEDGPFVDELRKQSIKFKLCLAPKAFLKVSRSKNKLATLFSLARSALVMPLYLLRLLILLRKSDTSVILSNSLKFHLLTGLLKPFYKNPVIWYIHDILSDGWIKKCLSLLSVQKDIFGWGTSRAAAASVEEVFELKSLILHPALDLKLFASEPNHYLHELLGVSQKTRLVGLLCSYAPWKGQLNFVHMASLLKSEFPNVKFVIIGGEIYDTDSEIKTRSLMENEITNLKLNETVYLIPFQLSPQKALNSLTLLVHASTQPEPFGRVIIEGMACGLPVLAASGGGVDEIKKLCPTLNTYSRGDVGAMSASVRSLLLKDPILDGELLRQQAEDLNQNFALEKYEEKIKVFVSILETGRQK